MKNIPEYLAKLTSLIIQRLWFMQVAQETLKLQCLIQL